MNIDATAMQQAGIGAGYIKNIINDRIASFLRRTDVSAERPINLVVRKLFNPNGVSSWFKSVVAIINQITLLTVVLTGAAVIREREHGTLEHLLVMPLSAFEIAMAKVWANGLVILVATGASLFLIVQMALKVPFAGSVVLWFVGVVLYLFFATALGIFLGTISRSMAQFALLIILVIVVLMLLSGGSTPVESQPKWLQYMTYFLPARHFVSFSQIIIYRGGGLSAVWTSVPDGGRDRSRVLRLQPGALPEIDRGDQVVRRHRLSPRSRWSHKTGGDAAGRLATADSKRPNDVSHVEPLPAKGIPMSHEYARPVQSVVGGLLLRPNTCSTPGSERS